MNTSAIVTMLVLSVIFVVLNYKRLMMSLTKCQEDIAVGAERSEALGKNALLVFTVVSTVMTLGYIYGAFAMGVIWMKLLYVLVLMKLVALMFEYMCLSGLWKYGLVIFIQDKIQTVVNILLSGWIIAKLVLHIC